MQAAPTTFLPLPPQNGYQPLSEAEIYAIKRQYLGLLSPQQIIDICLTFEAHAPIHIKSSVWPYDIRAAIASIQAQKTKVSPTQASPVSDAPLTASPGADSLSSEKTAQPQPSTSQQPTPAPSQPEPSTGPSSVPQPVATPESQTAPTAPGHGPHYSHQPHYHPSYPHAPYYGSQTTYGYPHPYPSYPQPPTLFAVNSATHHPSLYTNTPLVHPPHPPSEPPPPLNVDDLPSYEEMIVEALLDSGDPEGCAPKSLFSWMAMHYPLQMNFRPSASQALQKAYKRGRLEKGDNGKYRLNENWEGGNTSRRATRRPQTLAQTALPGPQPPSSSPFTHTPLVPHGATNSQARLPPPGQPPGYGGYPFGYLYQGIPGPAHASNARGSLGAASQKQVTDTIDHETGEGSDAWEAAQNILKAINFGQLFQISNEENKAGEPSTTDSPNQQASVDSVKPSLTSRATLEESVGLRHDAVRKSAELNEEQRAALQAQLALLAAQLAELADVSEDQISHNLEVSQKSAVRTDAYTPQAQGEGSGQGDHSDVDDSEDMVDIPVPMASLAA